MTLFRSVVSSGLTLLGLTALASPAFAQANPTSRPAVSARVHNYDIEGDELKGELPQPMLVFSTARGLPEHGSLIRVRTEFTLEMAKAAEDL